MNFKSYLEDRARLLHNRSYLAFLLNCLLAPLGNGFVYIALTWQTQSQTSSAGGVALLMLCLWGPAVILAPASGYLVDHGSPRIMALLSNLIRGIIILLLAFLISSQEAYPWYLIYGSSILLGALNSLYGPAAITLIRSLVTEKDLLYANSTADIIIEIGSVAGMGLAGIALAWIGFELSLLLGGSCFCLAGLCFVFVNPSTENTSINQEEVAELSFLKSIQESFIIILRDKFLRTIYSMQAILLMMLMTVPVLLAPYAQTVLTAKVSDFSTMEALFSIGAISGGLLIPYLLQKFKKLFAMGTLWALMALVFFILAKTEDIMIAQVVYFFVGFGLASWAVVLSTAQEKTPITHQGRLVSFSNGLSGLIVMGLYILLYNFGELIAVQNLYLVEALFCLLLVIFLSLNPSCFYVPNKNPKIKKAR